ncbi:MAG: hypothetical protein M1829_005550 [Trizodia sp. TS-e1964]|nr:MAG: hypothetical protein M1829_005550 [Trizodia sp. TS-e1964]
MSRSNNKRNVHFIILVRVPIPRNGFIDPPQIDWDQNKDYALWKVLSRSPKAGDIDWDALASRFHVSLAFLLQQSAWLYEQQMSQVRKQLRKVSQINASTTVGHSSGVAAPVSSGASTQAIKRVTSKGGLVSRVPSTLSIRSKDIALPRGENSRPGTPLKPTAQPMSRTSSSNTATQSRLGTPISPRHPFNPSRNPPPSVVKKPEQKMKHQVAIPVSKVKLQEQARPKKAEPSDISSSSSSSSDEEGSAAKNQPFRRPARLFSKKPSNLPLDGDEDDEEESPAFLPLSPEVTPQTARPDPREALRGSPRNAPLVQQRPSARYLKERELAANSRNTLSSTSSSGSQVVVGDRYLPERTPGPLSPRRTAELMGRSPRRKQTGSEGTPSMGSSFSDLDDASVTQSALEEALLSNMQGGGVASRMSTISQALRSRYL